MAVDGEFIVIGRTGEFTVVAGTGPQFIVVTVDADV